MIPSLLITFREVIEASLIVATILGILVKLRQNQGVRIVWVATCAAIVVSVLLLALGSIAGIAVQEFYGGRIEEIIEGILMIVSSIFITWAVFFLHTYFGRYKMRLLANVQKTVAQNSPKRLFVLVFTAVFREGFEIVLFLTTIYFSSSPPSIFGGFVVGLVAGLAVSFAFFSATLRMPVYWAFRTSSLLLILFAAGLLARGSHEFMKAEILVYPSYLPALTFSFLPKAGTFAADFVKSVFGLGQTMDLLQLSLYLGYVWIMHWLVFVRRSRTSGR